MSKTLYEIEQDFNAGKYIIKMDIPIKVPEGYIFDENLSVRRNREMVVEHNKMVLDMRNKKMHMQAEKDKEFTEAVLIALMGEYNLNRTQAMRIQEFVYAKKHGTMYEYFDYLDEIANLVEDVLSAKLG